MSNLYPESEVSPVTTPYICVRCRKPLYNLEYDYMCYDCKTDSEIESLFKFVFITLVLSLIFYALLNLFF